MHGKARTSLERHNLPALEVVERHVVTLGAEAFEIEVQRLAMLHTIDPCAPIRSITRFTHPTLIGMSDAPLRYPKPGVRPTGNPRAWAARASELSVPAQPRNSTAIAPCGLTLSDMPEKNSIRLSGMQNFW